MTFLAILPMLFSTVFAATPTKKICEDVLRTNDKFIISKEVRPFAGANVIRMERTAASPASPAGRPEITSVRMAEAGAGAPVEMRVRLANGREFNLLGARPLETLEAEYQASKSSDPYATNALFKPGVAGILFPMANRLTGRESQKDVMTAQIMGQTVTVPVNHGRGAGQRRHHLHGLAYDKKGEVMASADGDKATVTTVLPAGFHSSMWAGRLGLTVTQSLTSRGYEFEFTAENFGDEAVPVGGGAHPYFTAPSGNPEAVRLRIPGRKSVEIDGYENVLPTGRILDVARGGDMDFGGPRGAQLKGRYLDNLWIDLEKDEDGYAFTEFIDTEAGLRVRMTATSKNIVGIQAYAPKPGSNPALGVFAALELVTNLPDPREELWGKTPTGMKLLKPGEKFRYGYRIEVLPFTE